MNCFSREAPLLHCCVDIGLVQIVVIHGQTNDECCQLGQDRILVQIVIVKFHLGGILGWTISLLRISLFSIRSFRQVLCRFTIWVTISIILKTHIWSRRYYMSLRIGHKGYIKNTICTDEAMLYVLFVLMLVGLIGHHTFHIDSFHGSLFLLSIKRCFIWSYLF